MHNFHKNLHVHTYVHVCTFIHVHVHYLHAHAQTLYMYMHMYIASDQTHTPGGSEGWVTLNMKELFFLIDPTSSPSSPI